MPSALPDGEPAPMDGGLPEAARATLGKDTFSAYVHVPFCATRCGYCDFNTYTASELGGMAQGAVHRRRADRDRPRITCLASVRRDCRRSSSGEGRRHCCLPTTSHESCGDCTRPSTSAMTAR